MIFRPLLALPLVLFISLAILLGCAIDTPRTAAHSPLEGQPLPAFRMEGLDMLGMFITEGTMAGGPYIINVFSSWCGPCLAENQALLGLKEAGIPILGIAWKDEREKASAWLKTHGDPYALKGYDPDGETAVALGLSGVPETFVVDGDGTILFHHAGPLDEQWINNHILPHFTAFLQNRLQAAPPVIAPPKPETTIIIPPEPDMPIPPDRPEEGRPHAPALPVLP